MRKLALNDAILLKIEGQKQGGYQVRHVLPGCVKG